MPRVSFSSRLSIAQLETILAKRRSALSRLEKKRQTLQKRIDAVDAKIAKLGGAGAPAAAAGPRKRPRNAKSLAETIFAVLHRRGGPMTIPELVKGILATGYKSGSPQFRNIVNQVLIKDKRFAAAERGVYQLRK
jgi:hypothetical protein